MVRTTDRFIKILVFGLWVIMWGIPVAAQHGQEEHPEDIHEHEGLRRHKIAFLTGYTWVRKGDHEGGSGVVFIPTFGFDYEYWIVHKFAIGVFNDIEVGNYVVENSDGEEFKRENAFVTTLVAIVEPVKGWGLYAGAGIELEKHHHMWVVRIGTEYAWELPKDWSVALGASWDIKKEYDSIGVGITFGKRLGNPR